MERTFFSFLSPISSSRGTQHAISWKLLLEWMKIFFCWVETLTPSITVPSHSYSSLLPPHVEGDPEWGGDTGRKKPEPDPPAVFPTFEGSGVWRSITASWLWCWHELGVWAHRKGWPAGHLVPHCCAPTVRTNPDILMDALKYPHALLKLVHWHLILNALKMKLPQPSPNLLVFFHRLIRRPPIFIQFFPFAATIL